MATEKQIEANRRNAQLSTGPITPEGKEKVRGNALVHGFRAKVFDRLPEESSEEFKDLVEAWKDDYQPQSESEATLVYRAAVVAWKLERTDRIELTLTQHGVSDAKLKCERDCLGHWQTQRVMRQESYELGDNWDKIRGHQATLLNQLIRLTTTLGNMRKTRIKPAPETPQPEIPAPQKPANPHNPAQWKDTRPNPAANSQIPVFPNTSGFSAIKPNLGPVPTASSELKVENRKERRRLEALARRAKKGRPGR